MKGGTIFYWRTVQIEIGMGKWFATRFLWIPHFPEIWEKESKYLESKQPQKIDASINYCIKFCCCEELGKFFGEIINTMVSKIFLSISLNRKLISVEKSLLKRLYDTHVLEGKCLGTEFTLYKWKWNFLVHTCLSKWIYLISGYAENSLKWK